jgi:prephenate dehydrogenase
MIAAGGFRDITRISSSSPVMWQQICLTNRADILSLLDKYMAKLQESRGIIAASDGQAILDMFESARNYRESFSNLRGGALPQNFSIRVKIADHPGVLADVVSLLAAQDINIRNIGITHSREYEEGVLLLELHTRDGQEKAASVLRENGFEIEVLK